MKFTLSRQTYIYLFLIGISLFSLVASRVSAQTATPPAPGTIDYAKINNAQIQKMTPEERKAAVEAGKAAQKFTLEKGVQDRIINLSDNVTKRLTAGIDRMKNIIGRLDTRVAKLSGENIDTFNAEMKLRDAKAMLASAEEALKKVGSVKNAVTSETPRETFMAVRAQFVIVRDLLKQTHVLLGETVALLKSAPERTIPDTIDLPSAGAPTSAPTSAQ